MTTLQEKIIKEMGVKPEIDVDAEIRKSIDFMKDYLRAHSFLKNFVLGISGGQDSVLLGKLVQMAVEEMRAETDDDRYQFIAVELPYGEQIDEADTKEALDWIEADQVVLVNIQSSVDAMVKEFEKANFEITDFNKGNIKARARMMAQYAIAGEEAGVVLGTDHPAESVTGYFTKFGDGAADILPLYRLNKRQGKQLLKALGSPEKFYEKAPTADLLDDAPAKTDEEELGISYDAIDDYLEGKEVSDKAKNRIEELYLNSQHKRHLPIRIFDNFWRK